MEAGVEEFKVHRAGGAFAFGWFAIVTSALVLGSGLFGHGYTARERIVAVGVALAVAGAAYALGVRPDVEEEPTRLLVRNIVRDVSVPWAAVTDVRVTDVMLVECDDVRVRCYAVPRRLGRGSLTSSAIGFGSFLVDRRQSAEPRPAPRPGTNAVSERVRELAFRYGPQLPPGEVVNRFSAPALAALGAVLVGVLVAVLAW